MAVIGNIALGMSVDSRGFRSGVASAVQSFDVLKAAAVGLGAYAVGSFFTSAVKQASDLNETLSSTQSILGNITPDVVKFAEEMSTRFGLIQKDVLEAAAGFGGIAKGLGGLKGDELAKFTTNMTKLAADLQSNKNIASLSEAAMAIQIALSGEQSDTLKKMGIIINETTMAQYAMANGIAAANGRLSEQQKFMIRAAMVTKGLAFADKDLERTAEGAANQFRKAGGGIANFSTAIGQVLLPSVTSATMAFNDLLAGVIETFQTNRAMITGWADNVKAAFDLVGVTIRNTGDLFDIFLLTVAEKGDNVIAVAVAIGRNFAQVAQYISDNWRYALLDIGRAIAGVFQNIEAILFNFGAGVAGFLENPMQGFRFDASPILENFKSTIAEFPKLIEPVWVDASDRIAKIGQRIADRESARAMATGAQIAKAIEGPTAAGLAGMSGPKLASALQIGSKEAYTAIVRAQSGRGDLAKDTLKVLKDQLGIQRETLRALENNASLSLDVVTV